jgi:hypothetical protein
MIEIIEDMLEIFLIKDTIKLLRRLYTAGKNLEKGKHKKAFDALEKAGNALLKMREEK